MAEIINQFIQDLPMEATPLGGNARTLVDTSQLKVVNLLVAAGEEVKGHSAPVDVVVIVQEGSGSFVIENQSYSITAGQMLICPAHSTRGIIASENESLNLLVIRTPNL